MKPVIVFFLLFLISVTAQNQEIFTPNLSSFSKSALLEAQQNIRVNYMSSEEQNVIFYMNLVRLQPKVFLESILLPYVKLYKIEGNSYVKSLIKDLKKSKSVRVLTPKEDLFLVAKKHRVDIGKNGFTGHIGSNHNTFRKRASKIMRVYDGAGECIGFGYDSAIQNVIELLIDIGIPSLGHRKTILNGEYNFAGASIGYHRDYDSCCVIDYGIQ
jgi:hypothetical protein